MEVIDLKDMKNLSLSDLFEDENIDDNKLDLILRALGSKLLDIPARIEKANPNVCFEFGSNEAVMIDITDISGEMYELVSMLRECLPVKNGGDSCK